MKPFDPRPYLKEIARGKHGARDLSREQARVLFTAIFAGEISEVALGAVLVALRIKGESAEELAGMLEALAPFVAPLRLPRGGERAVVIPTYNGARKLPNLVPLLALMLAREGVPVLLHGLAHEPNRVGTFEILGRLGVSAAASLEDAERSLEASRVAAVPLALLAPALARLVERRSEMGVRNSGHTLAKLLLPAGVSPAQACRLVGVTHPEFAQLMREHLATIPGDTFLMRGVEGEAVVRLHAPQPIERIGSSGQGTHALGGEEGYALPERGADATAAWTRDVLDGRTAAPVALIAQVRLIAQACRAVAAAPRRQVP